MRLLSVSVLGLVVAGAAWAMLSGDRTKPTGVEYVISQKYRHFAPNTLSVHPGDTVIIVNDDADLHHHAYVSSPRFKFDSGDQQPGSRTPIVFSVPGRFNVLCGIHPKMRLVVAVQ